MKERTSYHVEGIWKTGKPFSTDRTHYRQALSDFALYRGDDAGVVRSLRLVSEVVVITKKRRVLKQWTKET